MHRVLAWLGVVALAVSGYALDSDLLRGAGALAMFAAFGLSAPGLLPAALAMVTIAVAVWIAAGFGSLLAGLPALIAAFVGWLFARTLRRGRLPLIARAIAAIDGRALLLDVAVAAYARRLTAVWAAWQFVLALCAVLLAMHSRGAFATNLQLPSPRAFGLIGLPPAIALLLLAEFLLRPRLLPQAPRRGFFDFLRALVRHWPALLDDCKVAGVPENRDAAPSP
jgi:hypothetical protein